MSKHNSKQTHNSNGLALKRLIIDPHSSDLIRLQRTSIDVKEQTILDAQEKIESNEMNSIAFYDIAQIENPRKKKGKTNFKSRRFASDLALIRGTKFFTAPSYSEFEKQSLKDIHQQPGKHLLMSEIYSQLEENVDQQVVTAREQSKMRISNSEQTLTTKESANQQVNKGQQIEKEVLQLDEWHKTVKKQKKLEEEQRKNSDQSAITANSKFQRTKTKKKTVKSDHLNEEDQLNDVLSPNMINERMKEFSLKNRDNVMEIAKQQISSISSVSPIHRGTPSLKSKADEKLKTGSSFHSQAKKVDLVEFLKAGDIVEDPNKKKTMLKRSETIKDLFSGAIKEMNVSVKQVDVPSNNADIKKQVLQYVNEVPNFHNKEESQFKKEELTGEGIKTILKTFCTGDEVVSDASANMVEKSKHYERISNMIDSQISEKIKEICAVVTNKSGTVRILRLENHTIAKKMTQIKQLSSKLQNDISEAINGKDGNDKLPELLRNISSDSSKKLSHEFNSNHSLSISHKRTDSNIPTPQKKGSTASSQNLPNRSLLIESVMLQQNRMNELEKEISILKESYQKFEQKALYNSEIIQGIEAQVDQKRKDFKQLSKAKLVFLYEILKFGQDCRQEGLSWIIRSIQNLGEKVFDSDLPDYLDNKGKDFLLLKSVRLQEINEITTLQNISLDIYKTNMASNEPLRAIQHTDQTEDYSIIQNNNANNTTVLNPNNSILSGLNKSQFQNLSLPSIKHNNNNSMSHHISENSFQSFSQVDVERIKKHEILHQKKKIMKSIAAVFEGLSQVEKESIESTIDQLNSTKLTTNDIIYNDTKSKIQQMLKRNIRPDPQGHHSSFSLVNSGLLPNINTTNNSIIHNTNSHNVSNFLDGLENEGSKLSHKIVLYENGNILNNYDNREQFIQEYEGLSKKLREKEKQLKLIEDKELTRVIKEYDYKNYEERYGVKCGIVLSSLFGAPRADREIIKNGMNKR